MVIFHSYVSLPEGMWFCNAIVGVDPSPNPLNIWLPKTHHHFAGRNRKVVTVAMKKSFMFTGSPLNWRAKRQKNDRKKKT